MVITVQQAAEILQAVLLSGVFVHRCVRLVVFLKLVGTDPNDALNGVQRNGVEVLAGRHHQCPVDRYGEGQSNGKDGALANGGVDVQAAT